MDSSTRPRWTEFTQVRGFTVPVDPDVILAVDGEPVGSSEELNRAISYGADIGELVTLTVNRAGVEQLIAVTLAGS